MDVVATAGHVDHGKSALVRALTGIEPDRWQQERDRGLTIDLGFVWTRLPGGRTVAFVDVPGHERFVGNMLAGVGPVPAALFVVAADEGWSAQSTEHLAALDALGVQHGVLAVTKADLADPAPALTQARERIGATSLGSHGDVAEVAVSAHTGQGLGWLRAELDALVARLPAPDTGADLRLWVDRSFSIRGAGTVVTGTLAAGSIGVGDELELAARSGRTRAVRVRGLQRLGEATPRTEAVARVAVNLRGLDADAVSRGDALLAPSRWCPTSQIDVALRGADAESVRRLPRELVLHVGAAAVPVRVRALDDVHARLRLARPLPMRTGDGGVLRDPGRHLVAAGLLVLDVDPPGLRRSGAAAARASELAATQDEAAATGAGGLARAMAGAVLRARPAVGGEELRRRGLLPRGRALPGGWYADEEVWADTVARARDAYQRWCADRPEAGGMPLEALRKRLALPAPALAELAAREAGFALDAGLLRSDGDGRELPETVDRAVRDLRTDLERAPFSAPEAGRLAELGLGRRELAAAQRAGRLRVVAEGIVLLPDAYDRAGAALNDLPQPFTVSQARRALGTTRRVAVPLLEALAAEGITERLGDGTHRVRTPKDRARSGIPAGARG